MARLQDADTKRAEELYNKLNTKEKVAHLWIYYRKIVVVIALFIALVGLVYVMWPVSGQEPNLRIKFINTDMPDLDDKNNYMQTDYAEYLGSDNNCKMELSYITITPKSETKPNSELGKMLFRVAVGDIYELFIMDEYGLEYMSSTDFLCDISKCLEQYVLEQVKEDLVYYEDSKGNVIPMAINITDTEYVKAAGIEGDGVYISFVENSSNSEVAKQFVTYILSK